MDSKRIKMLDKYAEFLESSLSKSGFNISLSNILEVTSDDISINNGTINPSLKLINNSRLDDILRFPTLEPEAHIVYAQFPIKETKYTIDNLAAIPYQTGISSVLGAYGLNSKINMKSHTLESIEMFRELLSYYGVDFETYEEDTKDAYYNLTVAKTKTR